MHLVGKVALESRLEDTRTWIFDLKIKLLFQAFLRLFTQPVASKRLTTHVFYFNFRRFLLLNALIKLDDRLFLGSVCTAAAAWHILVLDVRAQACLSHAGLGQLPNAELLRVIRKLLRNGIFKLL